MKTLPGMLAIVLAHAALAGGLPYDEAADARRALEATQAEARHAGVPVLVVFGANWCADCRILDLAFKDGAAAPLIAKNFRVVKVDVGKFDRNLGLARSLGVPVKKGIPAVAVLSADGRVVYATKAGELADARSMGDKAIYDFFVQVARGSR